jgi:hypothetical protein
VTAVVAASIFWIAYDDGSYGIGARSSLTILVCWLLIVGIVLSLWPLARLQRAAIGFAVLLACFACWTFASLAWTSDRETTFVEFDRVALFLSVFLLVVVASSRSLLGPYLDGITIAIAAIAAVAVISRLFPSAFSDRGLPTFLPFTQTRLSFPLGYWNGLAIFVALGLPLLLRGAASWRHPLTRGAAVGAIPILACVVYLASSRGGFAAAFVGAAVTLATGRRWAMVGALGAGILATAVTLKLLAALNVLVNGPVDSSEAAQEGHRFALYLAVVCVATACIFAVCTRLVRWAPPAWAGWGLAGVLVATLLAVTLAASPVTLFERFKAPPQSLASEDGDFVGAHLRSGNGSGRWQFWTSAADQWRERPLVGHGAGSYRAWWLAHASLSYFVRDAHSLYLQTLGELGLIGFLLLAGALLIPLAAGARRLHHAADADGRTAIAAALGAGSGWLLAAGIDWMWQLTATTVVAMVLFALLTGPATARRRRADSLPLGRSRRTFALRGATVACALAVIVCSAIPWLADLKLGASQAAVRQADGDAAATNALAARNLEPWASSPYLQLALVSEQAGSLQAARAWIGRAIDRSRNDWRLWLVAARIDTKLGRPQAARHELDRAIELNPRSPLFENLER